MAQSYGNPFISTIYSPVDTILATTKTEDPSLQAGKSVSGVTAATTTAAGLTLNLTIDGDAQVITLVNAMYTGDMIADYIQQLVRALTPIAAPPEAYTQFTCSFDSIRLQYTLKSGTVGATSSIVVTGGTAAPSLKLGLANGGTESVGVMAAGVVYYVHYFLTNGAGRFDSIDIPVAGTEMVNYLDLNELKDKANLLAAQWKQRAFALNDRSTTIATDAINGPVTL